MKTILKKVRVLSITLFSILLAVSILGCPSEGGTPSAGTTFQSQIDAATPGSTVTLNANNTGSSITINKALTVNGNQVENLSVIIASNVSNSVTLQNFVNANITVASSARKANSRMARTANDAEVADKFAKIGDGDLPLHIEGCTIDRLDLGKDVALYLENGDKKSTIEELNLRDGVQEFSFIEFDENGNENRDRAATATAAKSRVEMLNIEDDGVAKINLIGGVISDVDFADGVSASSLASLRYDREFSDQFGTAAARDLRDAITDDSKKEDVGVAKRTGTNSVYKFTIPRDIFEALDGKMTIVLLNSNQVTHMFTNHQGITWLDANDDSIVHSVATYDEPIYAVMPTGLFCVDWHSTNSKKTIYGSESAYVDYARVFARGEISYKREDVVVLDHYKNYNKEAFIVEVDGNNVNLYVNMAAIKKSDVILCNGEIGLNTSYGETGSKLTEIDLTGYTPYFAFDKFVYPELYTSDHPEPNIDDDEYHDENGELDNVAYQQAHTTWENAYNDAYHTALAPITYTFTDQGGTEWTYPVEATIPYGNAVKFSVDPTFNFRAPDTSNTPISYPNVSDVTYTEKETDPTTGRELLNQSFDSRD